MKSKNDRSVYSRSIILLLALAVLTSQTLIVAAVPDRTRSTGEITVTGDLDTGEKPFVLVNGERAFSGRTFFSNGTIATTDSSTATIDFGKIGRIHLQKGSSLTLNVSDNSIVGTLSTGGLNVSNGDGVAVMIQTPGDTVTNEASSASRFTVNVTSGVASISAESGVVRYNGGRSVATRQDDDDDDDDDGNIWVPIIVIGGAIGTVLLFTAFDDDDDVVSPVR